MDTVDRIFELLDETNMEQQVFAANVGVSEDTASNWRRRKSASYSKYIPQIAEILNTTSEYLLTGHGPKHRNVPESDTLSEEDAQLLRRIHALSPAARGKLLGYLDALSE